MPRQPTLLGCAAVNVILLALGVALWADAVSADDPSLSGGLFRSRDAGVTWASANPGRVIGAAVSLAISPTDPNHLLLATEGALMRSWNGGRDWVLEASRGMGGAVAVAFDADGRRVLVSTPSGLFRSDDGNLWSGLAPPRGTTPARAIVRGASSGRVYLAGWGRLAQSGDWGTTWSTAADGLPAGPVVTLLVRPGPPEIVFAVVGGRIWARTEGTAIWRSRMRGIPTVQIEAVAVDPNDAGRLWAAGAGRVFWSDDAGESWLPTGQPLPVAETAIHGIAASGRSLLLSTGQGLYRSADAGDTWKQVTENLPSHLEAGPLVCDPANPLTLYVGFALVPYRDLWRGALEGRGQLERIDPALWSWAFAAIGAIGVAIGAHWIMRYSGRPAGGLPSLPHRLLRSGAVVSALQKSLGRPLREPLVQFFLIGAAFFVLSQWPGGGGDPAGRRIEVSPAQVVRLAQAFTEQRGRPPTAAERKGLVDEYVREEILYREALAMGLDKGDIVVHRRLAQKMAAIVDDLDTPGDPTEAELRVFFELHANRYRGPARVRFTHIYFSGERGGLPPETRARAVLEKLRDSGPSSRSIPDRGDSFAPRLGDALRSQAEVAEVFGQAFSEAVVNFPAGVWQGPLRSTSGVHLVRVDERSAPPVPELAVVRDRVLADWRSARREEAASAAFARLRHRYEVVIVEPSKPSAATAEAGGGR